MIRGLRPAAPAPFQMRVDRPFWFSLIERHTGAVLVMGIVRAP